MSLRKRILITNDDGLSSPGLTTLARELHMSGLYDLRVVAPEKEQSGVGHCITIHTPLFAEPALLPDEIAHIPTYKVGGTPADCVKIALTNLFPDFKPDLVVSGINRGPNVGVNVLYSGTVAGAMEACLNDIPAIAFSLDVPTSGLWHFALASELALPIIAMTLEKGIPPWTALNVNLPNIPQSDVKGIRMAKHGVSGFKEYYIEEKSEGARRRFRLEGTMILRDADACYDASCLKEGYITVTPLGTCWQDAAAWEKVAGWSIFKK